ncbi:ABC-F type ribosomal protection protein [Streptomyces sp. BPPL-273]|uniref:ABC-F type ribosomal protection protein n=1 Tax=Streptomyces parvulus TaxID=146923 RepID=A0ABV5DEE0_9ACTN|nr:MULTISPECIES: ABC-F type ribosomal protection protein [Streptomyces]MCQ4195974.1 ABC-F type ribosomal protection protein [Streptomyces parvulus]WHM28588.1 ABC-F type ribosomal protection protein [Streptomyces sp. BPPL-273]
MPVRLSSPTASRAHSQLTLEEVTKRYDDHVVLDRVSLTVKPGEKAGVIGDNGSGKSTLLRLIAGVESADNGEVTVAAPGGLGHLPQRLELPAGATVRDVLDQAFADLRDLERRLHAAEAALAGDDGPGRMAELGDLQAEFEDRGGYEADARADAALHGLGLPGLDRDRAVDTLSGGERSRLALAATLAAAPELLLLDEPTNDLDDQAVDWLEKRLREHRGTVVVITHDRAFLEAVTTTILEVDPDRRTVNRYGDGYQGYLTAKAAARARWEREYQDHLAEIDRQETLAANAGRMLATIAKKGPWAFSGSEHHRARSSSSATSSKARNANERLKRLQDNPVPRPPDPLRFTVSLTPAGEPAADPTAPLAEASGLEVDGRLRLDHLSVTAGERLLITGPNGAGKSTLLRVLAGDLEPDRGTVTRAAHTGWLRQDELPKQPRRSVLAEFADGRPGHPDEYTDELLALGLFRRSELGLPVGSLSVGQRRRIDLARLVTRPVDLLLLDEPTNHLSPLLVEELEAALADYTGTVVVVTHDRRMRRAFTGTHMELAAGRRVTG